MTIVGKQGPSTADPQASDMDRKSPAGTSTSVEPDVDLPSYLEASGSNVFYPRPVNHVSISKTYQPIRDTWVIDTRMQFPADLLSKDSSFLAKPESERPNLELVTDNSSISAKVLLVSGSATRAILNLITSNSRAQFKMISRVNNQPFKLTITTSNAAMYIGLPRSFCGPIQFKSNGGEVYLSPGIKSVTMMLSNEIAFIGSWDEAGFRDLASWESDEVDATNTYASINVYYIDELERETFQGKMKNVLSWLGLS